MLVVGLRIIPLLTNDDAQRFQKCRNTMRSKERRANEEVGVNSLQGCDYSAARDQPQVCYRCCADDLLYPGGQDTVVPFRTNEGEQINPTYAPSDTNAVVLQQ